MLWQLTQYRKHSIFLISLWQPHADLVYLSVSKRPKLCSSRNRTRVTFRLQHWKDHGIRLDTKIQVYRTAILSSLLYGSEAWTPYRRHINKLDNFHMNCLRRISNTRWQDRLPNTENLDRCNITGIEAICSCSRSYVGAAMSTECRTAAYQSNYCTVN